MRQARQAFSALLGSMGHLDVAILMSWGCGALVYQYYPLATKAGYAGAVAGAFVFSLPVLFLASWLGAGVLAFVVDAKRSCLPGSQRLARRAKLLATALLLPALALPVVALAGSPIWRAWVPTVLVLVIALAEVLAPLLPVSAVGLFLLVALAAYWTGSGWADHEHAMKLFFVLLSAALMLLAIAKWRRVNGRGSRPASPARLLRTVCFRITQREALERAPRRAASRHGSWDRQPRAQIIRTCLGGMFVRLSTRQLVIGAVLLALFVVITFGPPWLGASGRRWVASTLPLAAAALVSSGFLAQISKLTAAQIAELALVPGLGAPSAQRRAFCSAVLSPPLLWFGIVLLLGSAGLLLQGEPLSSAGALAVFIFIILLTYTFGALQKLAALPRRSRSFIAGVLAPYLAIYMVYIELSLTPQGHFLWHLLWWLWIIAGVLVGAVFAIAIVFSVRRFAQAPHPFLA